MPRLLARRAAVYALLGLAVLIVAFPLVWLAATAVKSNGQIVDPSAPLWPTEVHWRNVPDAWRQAPFTRWFGNTVLFAAAATIGQLASGLLAGYAFAMFDFPGRRVLFVLALSGLMVPFTAIIVPLAQLLGDLHWLNTYQGLIVPNIASGLGTFLFRQFFLGTPRQLGEAARIDGAGEWRIFWRVYAPLARPAVAALGIILFLQNWNNFLYPLIVTDTTSMQVVSQGLSVFQAQMTQAAQYNLIMAASLITVVPVLLVAVAAQRHIVEGITLGAVD
ncbi:carbohydrate ABC transporter permease [Actinomadura macrotermitis]|uniref:L-arabinose transport system permease protein AraQ n=1 Tax=Actinomadura macrotermitis TaxID=2585200 RepID=A0A7K0C7D4_9ACTN|nr:carbohydrate ABC transporter permease [Actinomadura macrotermitis]MQY09345.1 L-arabinose transport system permease protein AraQ [Actinomadura macrotermitis]